jgi:hypothetical protein
MHKNARRDGSGFNRNVEIKMCGLKEKMKYSNR